MFRKREKKEFPPGTFIPTPARILAILQLCIAFTLILWIGGQPFLGDLFTYKSKLLIYQHTLGDVALLTKLDPQKAENLKPQFERNATRFSQLPVPQQKKVLQEYQLLQEQIGASFFQKMQKTMHLFVETSPYELAWIFLSILLSILLLKRIEGASQAVWLLPVLVAVYAYDNHANGKIVGPSPDAVLFPSESMIVNDYLKEPLNPQIKTQHEQLKKGWQLYLVQEWANEKPSNEEQSFLFQIEKGEYAFNLARLEKLAVHPDWNSDDPRNRKSPFLLFFYLLWNVYFAMKIGVLLGKRQEKSDLPGNLKKVS